jgi:hypothetical protein
MKRHAERYQNIEAELDALEAAMLPAAKDVKYVGPR